MPRHDPTHPSRRLLLVSALVLLATVAWRLPARWALAFAPSGASCEAPQGSLWRGGCQGLAVAGRRLEAVTWQAHPLALLRARLAVDVQVDDPHLSGSALLEFAPDGALEARALRAHLPIEGGWVPAFPQGWAGQLELALASARYEHGRPGSVSGVVRALGLQRRAPALALGDYVLRFDTPADAQGRQSGQLSDQGGPLALSGTLRLQGGGQYELDGRVAARPGAPPDLAADLTILGPADAQGRRPFSLAGVF